MSSETLLYFAIAVFSLLVLGLFLTYREFSEGEPSKQAERNYIEDKSGSLK